MGSFFLVLSVVLSAVVVSHGKTSTYVRKLGESADMPLDSDVFKVPHGYNAPQQVHITQGDLEGTAMIVSWVTVDEPGSNKVVYWSEKSKKKKSAEGKVYKYKYYDYHHFHFMS